ncbi:MAG: ribosomal protein S18-alanine N-acetyltransferase [Sneathiella sp.]|nr:ribosomal protein S18-alanine N-acetyltransferase [Sneathiella sp.]
MSELSFSRFNGPEIAPVLAQLHTQSFETTWSVLEFERLLALDGMKAYVISEFENPVGFSLYQIMGDEAEIITIGISKDHQKRGLGHLLLNEGLAYLKTKGVQRLFLEVSEENMSARNLYERNSFSKVGVRKKYYQVGSRKIDALVMEKKLNLEVR